jgi:hypothetical protein
MQLTRSIDGPTALRLYVACWSLANLAGTLIRTQYPLRFAPGRFATQISAEKTVEICENLRKSASQIR